MTEKISVQLPLSMRTTHRLLQALDAAWPGATLVTDSPAAAHHLVVEIDNDAVADGAPIGELAPMEPNDAPAGVDVDGFLVSLRDSSLGISLPDWFVTLELEAMRDILDAGEAPNYVEHTVRDPATREVYTVTVGRPGGRTAHELRVDAEARAERAEAALRELAGAGAGDIAGLSAETIAALRVATDTPVAAT
jgi:hypothetical protein